ncbi:UNVERIFIED_CONTAM: hypothetical protein GTU68_061939, partial [Idotea baltica]|nr:hypothetical protein [Idotea baltica]
DLVELLIQYGAELDRTDILGRSALHYGALVSQSQVVELLLKAGADAKIEDKHGHTALHFAVDSLGTGLEGIAALSKAYPWAAIKPNEQKKTPLHIIVGADRKEDKDALMTMLNAMSCEGMISPPACLSPRSERGHTPLHLAVLERKVSLVRLLIASGAEVDTRDQLGRTPLECAVRDMDWNIVALLLAAGASMRRLINEDGLLPHVKDDTIGEMLINAYLNPMKLSSLCRRVVSRTWGPSFQRNLDEFPRTWRDFLSYREL